MIDDRYTTEPAGTRITEEITPVSNRPFILADSVAVGNVGIGEPAIELVMLGFQMRFTGQVFALADNKVGDNLMGRVITSTGIMGGTEIVDRGAVRFAPKVAWDAAVAIFDHGIKSGLVTKEEVQSRLRAAGLID